MAHPFQLPHGNAAITEIMQYFGSLSMHVEQQTAYQAGHITMIPRSDLVMAAGVVEGETALSYWGRDYKNQRRYVQRQQQQPWSNKRTKTHA